MFKKVLFVFCLLFLIINSSVTTLAVNTGFATEDMPYDKIQDFLSSIELSVFETEPTKMSIVCFDVNEDNMIAIGSNTFGRGNISVYNEDGVFQYGYKFKSPGSFGVEFDKNNLNIYFARSYVALTLTPSGEVEKGSYILDTYENSLYWSHQVDSNERIVGDTKYSLDNDIGILNIVAFSFSQLISTNSDGFAKIIYDANQMQIIKYVGFIIFVCLFFAITLYRVKKTSGKNVNQGTENTGDGSVSSNEK